MIIICPTCFSIFSHEKDRPRLVALKKKTAKLMLISVKKYAGSSLVAEWKSAVIRAGFSVKGLERILQRNPCSADQRVIFCEVNSLRTE